MYTFTDYILKMYSVLPRMTINGPLQNLKELSI
jgi:hypothetical protein